MPVRECTPEYLVELARPCKIANAADDKAEDDYWMSQQACGD
ncbi:MAG: hypothetical protein ACKVN9_02270 [Methylophilaceae bacterium]